MAKIGFTAFPAGTGTHHIQVNREMRNGAGVKAGDRATVVLERETPDHRAPRREDDPRARDRLLGAGVEPGPGGGLTSG